MIVRVKASKDAFTFGNLVKNTGLDEILEIGHSDLQGAEGSSKAFLSFVMNKPDQYEVCKHKVTLNLKEVRSENLTNPCILDVYAVDSDWSEGVGQISDEPHTTGSITCKEEPSNVKFVNSVIFTPESRNLDIRLDVTDLVDNVQSGTEVTFMIRLADESLADDRNMRLMYYGKDTHTCSWPYLDFELEDSVQDSDLETVSESSIKLVVKNLHTAYSKGARCRVNVNALPVYPVRQFTTSSIYRKNYRVPEGLTYGIKDEYTGEIILEAKNNLGTVVSSDNSGSFFILDTEMLEPERYYRLDFSLPENEVLVHSVEYGRYTFRINR